MAWRRSTITPLKVTPIAGQWLVSRIPIDLRLLVYFVLQLCCSKSLTSTGQPGTYGAAASDISPDISGGKCDGSINLSNCNGQSPINGGGPSCPKTNCGKCYKVTNQGAVSGGEPVGGTGNSVIVQIIDSCPSANPQNYCKTDSPPDQTCEDPNTNQLDIDNSAYEALTGQAYGSVSIAVPLIVLKTS